MPRSNDPGLLLHGLDGSNPLGFLAAVGALLILGNQRDCSGDMARMGSKATTGGWLPVLMGCGNNEDDVCAAAARALTGAPDTILDIGNHTQNNKDFNKFPFHADDFAAVLDDWTDGSPERRDVDLLAAFGTEIYPDQRNGDFQCTAFKMVRSGDSSRQGMLHYAKKIRQRVTDHAVKRTLFERWDYGDEDYSLRWDPIENQPYALRWRDPSKSKTADGPGTMVVANCLAFEALRLMPCMPIGTKAHTTGFQEVGHRRRFVWPIWTPCVNAETLRSLLSLRDLHQIPLNRFMLHARGVREVYGAWVVRPNQYYSNFASAEPIS
ncbi:MAG: hypothetical protein F4X83_08280 [Chloroflexi bacterium]|nr:hypothetical protein [Chloroflexota bacterium]